MSYAICRHIKTNGKPCRSPALRESDLCYFHRRLRRSHTALLTVPHTPTDTPTEAALVFDPNGLPTIQTLPTPDRPPAELNLPLLEDPESILVSISLVVAAIASIPVAPRSFSTASNSHRPTSAPLSPSLPPAPSSAP
jgi:hypothetical protein